MCSLGILNDHGVLTQLVLLIGGGPFLLGEKLKQRGIGGSVLAPQCALQVLDTSQIGCIQFADAAGLLVRSVIFCFGNQFATLFLFGGFHQFVAEAGLFEHEADHFNAVFLFDGGAANIDGARFQGREDHLLDVSRSLISRSTCWA